MDTSDTETTIDLVTVLLIIAAVFLGLYFIYKALQAFTQYFGGPGATFADWFGGGNVTQQRADAIKKDLKGTFPGVDQKIVSANVDWAVAKENCLNSCSTWFTTAVDYWFGTKLSCKAPIQQTKTGEQVQSAQVTCCCCEGCYY